MTQEVQIEVGGMSCQHCVKSVEKAVGQLPGVEGVSVDLEHGKVFVAYRPEGIAVDTIKTAIEEQGYDVE